MILNPWDHQSKHIHTTDSVASALCAYETRWQGESPWILVEAKDELSEQDRTPDGEQPSGQLLRTGRI